MKKVIITGPTGAIGIALIKRLIQEKVYVLAVCRKGSKRIANIPSSPFVEIVECNLDELLTLSDKRQNTYDIFYHFGWDATFGEGRNDMYLQNSNIKYTLDAVEVAKILGCSVFIGAGSQAEYGRVEGILHSDTPTFPENGYGIAKLCAGQMSRIKCRQYKIRHIWTRILSVYGPYDGEKTMIMSTIEKLLKKEKPVLTKGEQQWDYLYSKDAANMLFELHEKGKDGFIYCLGSGIAKPLLEYIIQIREIIDRNLPLGVGEIPYSENQVMHLCADISPLIKDTGYQCQYTFDKGIEETIQWFKRMKENEKN